MFANFKSERDDFIAQKNRFFESIDNSKKEIPKASDELQDLSSLIQAKLADAQQKTSLFSKIERWIAKTEPVLATSSQRIADIRKRYDAKKNGLKPTLP